MSNENLNNNVNNEVTTDTEMEIMNEKWNKSISKTSRIGGFVAICFMIMVPLVITIVYAEDIDVGKTLLTIGSVMLIFGPTAVAENFSLYPIMGIGGLILSVVTGNVSNMKMPAAMSGLKIAEAEIGSPEAEVVSIIAVGVSAIVTTLILIVGMIFGSYLLPYLENPILKPGFDVVLPSLLGAMMLPLILSSAKQIAGPFIFAAIMFLILGPTIFSVTQGFILIAAMGISVGLSILMYKKGILKKD